MLNSLKISLLLILRKIQTIPMVREVYENKYYDLKVEIVKIFTPYNNLPVKYLRNLYEVRVVCT